MRTAAVVYADDSWKTAMDPRVEESLLNVTKLPRTVQAQPQCPPPGGTFRRTLCRSRLGDRVARGGGTGRISRAGGYAWICGSYVASLRPFGCRYFSGGQHNG